MIRAVKFLENGDIVLSGEKGTDVIASGVAMLTAPQAAEAQAHGWTIEGEPETATVPPLHRVKR
jgi:hypothetical protein